MSQSRETKLLGDLRRWQQGESLHHQTLVALTKRGYLLDGKLTEEGRQALAIHYLVEQRQEGSWQEINHFADQHEAEAYASRLSVLNYALYQVRSADQPAGVLFEFGKRFQMINGVRVALPTFATRDDETEMVLFWCIEKRTSALYNEGRYAVWERISERRWSDREDAEQEAQQLAQASPALEFRIIPEDALPPDVQVYRGDALVLDVGLIETLVTAEMSQQQAESVFELRAKSAASLIAQWGVQPPMVARVAYYLLSNY